MSRTTVVAISGGVDSSVAALRLRDEGHDLVAFYMDSGLPHASAEPARQVADQLGIELHVLEFHEHFRRLIAHWAEEYGRGRTPNPCLVCNRELKFGALLDEARRLGADGVATGHYARRELADGEPALFRGSDPRKDQSYALFGIRRERLGRIRFPLGRLTKDEVRRIAAERGLVSRRQNESQDICFVPEDYLDLLRQRRPELLRPGPIVDETGREVGRHEGVAGFTIGQRRGLGVALGEPRYVTALDAETATVTVGPPADLAAGGAIVRDVNWLIAEAPQGPMRAEVQIRYHHRAAPSTLEPAGDGGVCVTFDEPQRAVTPGQGGVFYEGDRVLGGGWIERALPVERP